VQDCFDFIYFNYAEELPGEVGDSSCAQVERALADDEIQQSVLTKWTPISAADRLLFVRI